MSFDSTEFTTDTTWSEYDVVKPPRFLLPAVLVVVVLGGVWSVLCFLDAGVFAISIWNTDAFDAHEVQGLLGYLATLLVPIGAVAYMRSFHVKHSKENGSSYDAYSGQIVATRLRHVAILGLVLSMFAIAVVAWPISQRFNG